MAKQKPKSEPQTADHKAAKSPKTMPYTVLTSVLFGHRMLTMGSVVELTAGESEALLARGVVKPQPAAVK